jgi:hypothetical protein
MTFWYVICDGYHVYTNLYFDIICCTRKQSVMHLILCFLYYQYVFNWDIHCICMYHSALLLLNPMLNIVCITCALDLAGHTVEFTHINFICCWQLKM